MAYVPIPKDLNKVKTKVALNLTKRQLIGLSIAALISFPVYYFCSKKIGTTTSVYIMCLFAFPVLFAVFYEKNGIVLEKYIKYMYRQKFYQPQIRYRKGVKNESKAKETRTKVKSDEKKL